MANSTRATHARSRYRASGNVTTLPFDQEANDWISKSEDVTDTFGIGANGVIVKDKLDMDTRYSFSRSRGQLLASNRDLVVGTNAQKLSASVSDFPESKTEIHNVSTSLKWHFLEALTVKLKYEYESYSVTDFSFDAIRVWQPSWNQSVFLDASQDGYNAHIVGLSLIYKF